MIKTIMPLLIAAGCIIKSQAMHKEIELKLQLDEQSHQALRAWLEALNIAPVVERHTEYYLRKPEDPFDESNGFKDTDETLRIRITDTDAKICYKKAHRDPVTNRSTHRDESETTIGDPEVMLRILENAGYTSRTFINKTRVAYMWTDANNIRYEIAFDEIEGLGSFVEIELKSAVQTVADGLAALHAFLKDRGISRYKLFDRSYVHMFWNPGYDFSVPQIVA